VNWLVVVLRLLHVFFGVFWGGSVFTMARFVLPTAAASGAEGQRFMRRLALERGLTRTMVVAGVITVLAGLALMWHDSAGFQPYWMTSGFGVTISVGGLSAIGALVTGIRSAMLMARLGKLLGAIEAAGGAPSADQLAEAQGIGARIARRVRAVAVQLVIAVVCMAVARYVAF